LTAESTVGIPQPQFDAQAASRWRQAALARQPRPFTLPGIGDVERAKIDLDLTHEERARRASHFIKIGGRHLA
jgi:hypothetical protein